MFRVHCKIPPKLYSRRYCYGCENCGGKSAVDVKAPHASEFGAWYVLVKGYFLCVAFELESIRAALQENHVPEPGFAVSTEVDEQEVSKPSGSENGQLSVEEEEEPPLHMMLSMKIQMVRGGGRICLQH